MNLGECRFILVDMLATILNILPAVKKIIFYGLYMVCLWFVGACIFDVFCYSELMEFCEYKILWGAKNILCGAKNIHFRKNI